MRAIKERAVVNFMLSVFKESGTLKTLESGRDVVENGTGSDSWLMKKRSLEAGKSWFLYRYSELAIQDLKPGKRAEYSKLLSDSPS